MSGLRSSRKLLDAPMIIRMVLAVLKHLQITNVITLDNFDFKNFSKMNPWGCPGSVGLVKFYNASLSMSL